MRSRYNTDRQEVAYKLPPYDVKQWELFCGISITTISTKLRVPLMVSTANAGLISSGAFEHTFFARAVAFIFLLFGLRTSMDGCIAGWRPSVERDRLFDQTKGFLLNIREFYIIMSRKSRHGTRLMSLIGSTFH